MKHIGILGGTFDPPHIGHLMIAEEVRFALKLDEIWFVPTADPPHKRTAHATSKERIEMVRLMTEDEPAFNINSIEVNRGGTSYTYETLNEFKKLFPNDQFYFIIGADMVEYLPHWYKIDELMKLVTFVGVKRSGYTLNTSYPIKTVDVPVFEVSSSDIRKRIRTGRPVKHLVCESVYSYIKERRLYEPR